MPAGPLFTFGPFALDVTRRRLMVSGDAVAISDRQLDVLLLLVARAGRIVPKDELLQAGWKDVAVADNSIEQAISSLRRLLGAHASGLVFIETVARRGYRFGIPVTRSAARETDEGLDALIAPHRAFLEGRAALETLEGERIAEARHVFESTLRSVPDYASAHIGMANACAMQFEMTRVDPSPDTAALATAGHHAREACRLDPASGEAWATLAFVFDRTGQHLDARAAAQRAVSIEPDNWRHHFRLAYVSWGDERLRAAHRTLALLPGFPLAHWLAATVHVARQALDEAERELVAGLQPAAPASGAKFSAVALHWLLGLILLARGNEADALRELECELSLDSRGQLYARECIANTWYAIGAIHFRHGRSMEARAAFDHAQQSVVAHPMAQVGRTALDALERKVTSPIDTRRLAANPRTTPADVALWQAASLAASGDHEAASRTVAAALAQAPPGNAAWLLPVEPLLHVSGRPHIWSHVLASLRNRAS